jgi:NTP pyrophosphatase (non-canonical NTP hydrolase)
MPDATTTVQELKEAIRRFADERSWGPYHSPKNLVMALTVEVAELTEHFLWLTSDESCRAVDDPARKEAIADELADVACLVLNFSLNAGLDLSDAIRTKMAKNAIKYPANG